MGTMECLKPRHIQKKLEERHQDMPFLEERHQDMPYSGVGAHGQHKITERRIQTVVHSSRTMMLHQSFLWPENFDTRL